MVPPSILDFNSGHDFQNDRECERTLDNPRARVSILFLSPSSQTPDGLTPVHPTTVRSLPPVPVPLQVFIALPRSPRRCGVDVVKLPRGHRPLSPGPSATGHGHCPLVYLAGGISRNSERRTALYGSICTHGKMVSLCIRAVFRP